MCLELLFGFLLSVGLTVGAVLDWDKSGTGISASGVVFLLAGPILFLQYFFNRDILALQRFYRKNSLAAREQQRTAGFAVMLILVAIYIVGAWGISAEGTATEATVDDRNALVGWRLLQIAYFGTLLFYLPAIVAKRAVSVMVVCALGAVEQLAALIVVVVAVSTGNPLLPASYLVIQTVATTWAVGYDFITYNGLWCCCDLSAHRGPNYYESVTTVGTV